MTATILKRGEIAIIGYNADDPSNADTISFVLLAPIGSGTQIFFTDRNWNGTAFPAAGSGDGTYTYTAGSDLAAGTIVTITTAQLNAAGINLADTGDTIYVFQGSNLNTPTTFLYAADIADGDNVFNGNLTNTGLSIAAGTAVAIKGDNGVYGDRGHNIQTADLLTAISSPTNWTSDDNSLELTPSGNLLSAPDQQVWSVIAGDAGLLRMSRDGVDTASQQLALFQSIDNPLSYFNHPNDIVFDTVHGLFFVADSDTGNRRILQGNIADLYNPGVAPTLKVLYSDSDPNTSHGQINGLAIDVEAANGIGNLYFVNQGNFEKITYAWNGNSTLSQTPSILATLPAGSFANEIALDIANHRAFVLSEASNTQAIPAQQGDPGAQFDPDSGTYYVVGTAATNNELWQVTGLDRTDTSIAQTTFAKLVIPAGFVDPDGGSSAGDFNDLKGLLESIDIDPAGNFLYFTAAQLNNGVNNAVGGIYRYNLANGTIDTLYTEGNSTDYLFKYIDVDPVSGKYFVSNNSFDDNTGADTSTIMVHGLSAGAPTLFGSTPISNAAVPWGLIVDNGPTLSGSGTAATYTETAGFNSGFGTRVITANGFTANDPDTAGQTDQLGGAQVRISTGFLSGATHQDQLTISGAASGTLASGISFNYNSADGVLTLTGANTFANYQAALALVQFAVSGDNPTNYGTDGSRTLAYSVTDGLMYSDEVFASVTVTGVNDNPINLYNGSSTVPTVPAFNEDTSKVFSTANGNALNVSDPDADPALQPLQVTLTVLHGTLTLASTAGLSFSPGVGDGTADTTMTFTGTANAINAALGAGLTYTPIADYNGSDTLTFTTSDQGSTGTGGALTDSDMVALTINPVVDIADDTLSFNEDSGTHTLAMPNNDTFENSNRAITAVTQGTHGTVTINDNSTPNDKTDDFLVYTQVADYNGADTFTYTVTSGGVTETATVTVNITAVADIVADSPTTNEDTAANVFVQGNDSFENSVHTVTIATGPSHGTAVLNDNSTPDPTDDYIVYTPNADYNGADSFQYTVTSGGVTETATVSMTVTAVADIAPDSVTVLEDSGANNLNGIGNPVSLLANDSFENSGRFISSVTQGSHGTVTISDNGTSADKTDDYAVYTPAGNYNGPDSFNYTVTSPAGVFETATVTVGVTSVNDAPVVDLNGAGGGTSATLAYTENGAAAAIAPSGTVTDIDSPDLSGGSLTVAFTANGSAADQLTIQNQGTGAGQIGVSGSNVTYGNVAIGTFSGGTDGTSLVISFNSAAATPAAVQALADHILYANSSDAPSTLARTLTFTVVDGDGIANNGADTGTATATINVTAVNDAPVLDSSANVVLAGENEDAGAPSGVVGTLVSTLVDLNPPAGGLDNVTDPDSASIGIAVIAANTANGAWFFSIDAGTSWQALGAVSGASARLLGPGDLLYFQPSADFNGTIADGITFRAWDQSAGTHGTLASTATNGGSTPYSATMDTGSITIAAMNDAPAATITPPGGGFAAIEQTGLSLKGHLSVADVDGGAGSETVTLSVDYGVLHLDAGTSGAVVGNDGTTSVTVTGTVAQINALLSTDGTSVVSYTADTDTPPASATLTLHIDDNGSTGGGNLTAQVTSAIAITAVSDAPSVTDESATTNDTADHVFASADFTAHFADPNDSPANHPLNVIITSLPATGTLTYNGTAINAGQVPYTISVTDLDLGKLHYVPAAGSNGSDDNFGFEVQDNGGVANSGQDTSSAHVFTLHIAAADAAPVIDLDGSTLAVDTTNNASYIEQHAPTILAPTLTLSDADDTNIESATVSISGFNPVNPAVEYLSVNGGTNDTIDGITFSYNAFTGVLSFTGTATLADYQALLQQVGYESTSDDPGTSRTISWVVNDGTLDSAAVTTTLAITQVDDAPVANDDAFTTDEATAITTHNVFDDNGSGPDGDVDGPPVSVSAVNGVTTDVGHQITLASGALLTLNADGTFAYDPHGAFDATPTSGSGALNTPAHDSFTYTLQGGATATVSVTVDGLDTNDILDGRGPDATMSGGIGNDIYLVDSANDQVNEATGEGRDIIYSSVSYALVDGSDVESLSTFTWQSTTPINLTGNDLDNYLIGNDGVNVLDGGGGADIMVGRSGNDVYIVDNIGDATVDLPGEGANDAIYTKISFALNDSYEIETLSTFDWHASTAINLTGNSLDNYIIGNDGSNVLDGKGGADIMVGLGGDDVYYIDNAGDNIFEAVGGGTDAAYTAVSYALRPDSEVETLSTLDWSGTTAIDLTGNNLANYIIGNAGANMIDGGDGNDVLAGQGGADTFVFDTALGPNNIDHVADFVSGTDKFALDDAIFTAIGGLGNLDPAAFFAGTAAHDADDRIIYDQATGNLYYDADGNGAGAAILFAVIDGQPILTASDLQVI